MCFIGFETSLPPACFTNSAGDKKLPWQTHTILTWPFMYLYKNPSTLLPFGPSPMVVTLGICFITSISLAIFAFLDRVMFGVFSAAGQVDFLVVPMVSAVCAFLGSDGEIESPEPSAAPFLSIPEVIWSSASFGPGNSRELLGPLAVEVLSSPAGY